MHTLELPTRRPLVSTVSPCVLTITDQGNLTFGDPDPAVGGEAVLRTMVPQLSALGFKVSLAESYLQGSRC